MCKIILLSNVFILNILHSASLGIFHENTKITFRADSAANYFGYSVLLSDTGLKDADVCKARQALNSFLKGSNAPATYFKNTYFPVLFVGAPKAKSRTDSSISPGLVFSCPIDDLNKKNITCTPYGITDQSNQDYVKDDMWFGNVIAMIPPGELLACAPRWSIPYNSTELQMNGACYIYNQRKGQWLFPLQDTYHQVHIVGLRPKRMEIPFYVYGQAGMSVKVTEKNTLVIGAVGLLGGTGGVSEYMFYPDFKAGSVDLKTPLTTNLLYTKDMERNDYTGYSVESGVFDTSGKTLYVAGAPRAKTGYGQVVIFESPLREIDPLKIKAMVQGPQVGSYFGSSILCSDVNGDGVVDLLVGAPNYVKDGDSLSYDHGAVFIYLTKRQNNTFVLKDAGFVMGSESNGARFGTAIAELGDVDGDGFTDIAIGAPYEKDGMGAVYIYRGCSTGLKSSYIQKVIVEGSKSFGISISKGTDVDSNYCNDLAVGAYQAEEAYIFRCIPTIQVSGIINASNATNLSQNVTDFTVLFCVNALAKDLWPNATVDLRAKITVDPEGKRCLSGDTEYNISVKPGYNACEEQTVEVMPTADLSKPILIQFTLVPIDVMKDDSSLFLMKAARISEDSILQAKVAIQLTRDCGEDLICTPFLTMSLQPLTNPYIPGSDDRLGFIVKVLNEEEPAYGGEVYLQLPSNPKKLPNDCILQELNVTCTMPSPLYRNELVLWHIEMEFTLKGIIDRELRVFAGLEEQFHKNDSTFQELKITVTPVVNISISAKALPNKTIAVTRDKFDENGIINFVHYYEVTNFGPSDLYRLSAVLKIPEQVNLSSLIKGCQENDSNTECTWSLPANVSKPIILPIRFDLGKQKVLLEENNSVNITSTLVLLWENENQLLSTTTTLVLDPARSLWPLIVGAILGLILLALIVFCLYKAGFFSRTSKNELKKLREQSLHRGNHRSSSADVTSSKADLLKN